VWRMMFNALSAIGRPFGGVRPRRVLHFLARAGYSGALPARAEFRWVRDRDGSELLLHPFFLIDRSIIAFGSYDAPLQNFLAREISVGMTCIDVGANIGAAALPMARRVRESGRVVCFEPVPHIAERLRQNSTKNRLTDIITVHQVALTDRVGVGEMAIPPSDHTNQGMGSLVERSYGDLTKSISVKCQTLDSFIKDHPLTRLDFLKVDIQGAEPLFLKGAQNTLNQFAPMIAMELAPSSLASSGYSSRDVIAMMEHLGYSAWTLSNSGKRSTRLSAATCPDAYSADNVLFERRALTQ